MNSIFDHRIYLILIVIIWRLYFKLILPGLWEDLSDEKICWWHFPLWHLDNNRSWFQRENSHNRGDHSEAANMVVLIQILMFSFLAA